MSSVHSFGYCDWQIIERKICSSEWTRLKSVASVTQVLSGERTPNLAEPPVNHTLSGPDSFPGSYSFRLGAGVTRLETPLGSIKSLAKATRSEGKQMSVYHQKNCCRIFLSFILKMPSGFNKTDDYAASTLASLAAASLAFKLFFFLPPVFFQWLWC